jgi:prephenate dehydrogenase
MSILFNNVTIIGVGLIGGSLAKVLKAAGLAGRITGTGRSRKSLEQALKLGVIDVISEDRAQAVDNADLIVLASPVGTFEQVVRDIGPRMKSGAILTDVGSVKGDLVRRVEKILPPGVSYVPGHPIAGKEKYGVAEASASLFRGAQCILTPTQKTDARAIETVRSLWAAAGAQVLLMDADTHDRVFAAVSHVPHVAAYAMVNAVAGLNTGTKNYIDFSGAGFKDFTRIAASSPEIWRDICLMNGKNIVEILERYEESLDQLKKAIHAGDGAAMEKLFRNASDTRKKLG